METAHGGEVIGEGVGVSHFQLLNQELDVGGDKFLFGGGLLAVDGGDVAGLAIHVSRSLVSAFAFARPRRTRHVHAERHLAKAGVARRKGRGLPILGAEAKLERKGRSAAEVCTSPQGAEDWGNPLRRAIGAEPLSEVWLPYSCAPAHDISEGGRCGQEQARRDGSARPWLARGEETSSRPTKEGIFGEYRSL